MYVFHIRQVHGFQPSHSTNPCSILFLVESLENSFWSHHLRILYYILSTCLLLVIVGEYLITIILNAKDLEIPCKIYNWGNIKDAALHRHLQPYSLFLWTFQCINHIYSLNVLYCKRSLFDFVCIKIDTMILCCRDFCKLVLADTMLKSALWHVTVTLGKACEATCENRGRLRLGK